jgi:phosphatidylinositol alpha-1,6-mannosyltransferase
MTERYLPHEGGSRRYYHELACRLRDCVVLTGSEPGSRAFDAASKVKIVRRIGVRFDYERRWYRTRSPHLNVLLILVPRWASLLFWTWWEILRRRPAILHAGGYLFPGVVARLLGPRLRIPYLVYLHGEDAASAVKSRQFLRCLRWVAAGAERVVANSRTTARLLVKHGVAEERIMIATPGVDPARWVPREGDARERLGIRTRPVLVSVGRLERHKGFAGVIEALPQLAELWPDIHYLLVGVGREEKSLRSLAARLGVDDRVHWMGSLDHDQLRDAYAAADLFVQPNGEVSGVSEGYGMVYLEAGAAGLAVIGGRSGGVVEAVVEGVTGVLVTPFERDELVATVHRLLENDELRRRMGEAGRKLAHERIWDRTLELVLKLDESFQKPRPLR